jgi:hypothetical protein
MTNTETPAPIELAYRIPGRTGFVRAEFATEAAADRFIATLLKTEGDDVEIRWAD